jgi:tetratricopeptide (TPR) repeat protein
MRRRRGEDESQELASARGSSEDWLAKGMLHERDRQSRLAIKAYERAARIRDATVAGPACLNLGRLYEQDRQPRQAIRAYEHAIRLRCLESAQAELALKRLPG